MDQFTFDPVLVVYEEQRTDSGLVLYFKGSEEKARAMMNLFKKFVLWRDDGVQTFYFGLYNLLRTLSINSNNSGSNILKHPKKIKKQNVAIKTDPIASSFANAPLPYGMAGVIIVDQNFVIKK